MELCIGMICGTIPALRPLFVNQNRGIRIMRGKYWKSDSHTLELNERGRREPSSQGSAPTSSADRIQPAFVASSTSEEIITEPHNVDGIRKTLEIEVKNEAADNSNDGRKAYKEDWNSVRRTSPLDFP